MRLLTPDQALKLDQKTFSTGVFRSEDFIQRAGLAVVEHLRLLSVERKKIAVLAGPGNNGADAIVVARELSKNKNSSVQLFKLQDAKSENPDFSKFEVVIDGLFGVGLNRPLEGRAQEWVEALNHERIIRHNGIQPLLIIAIDVPSGLNALTGYPFGIAVRAHETVTFQAAKPGFFQNDGPQFTGRVRVQPLPYPEDLFKEIASTHFACGEKTAALLIPRRKAADHKGHFGVLNLVAGSAEYPGAAVLTARAALRTGVGYLRLIQFEPIFPEWFEIPETLFQQWSEVPEKLDPSEAWAIGPGLLEKEKTKELIQALLKNKCEKVVIDASALEVVYDLGVKLPKSWILTPHPKELGELLGMKTSDVQENRFSAAQQGFDRFGATILLKGYKSVVHQSGKNWILMKGHSALAKAGSGDVLTGILGSLRAQGLGTVESAVLAGLIHGLSADLWMQHGDAASLTPSDVIKLIPAAQKRLKSL